MHGGLQLDYCDLESTGNAAYIGYKSEKKSQNFWNSKIRQVIDFY